MNYKYKITKYFLNKNKNKNKREQAFTCSLIYLNVINKIFYLLDHYVSLFLFQNT